MLLSREITVPVTKIAAPLAEIVGVAPAEVTRGLRQSPWVLLRDVPAIKLDEVFAALAAANVPAKAVPEAWLPRLPTPLAVRTADPMPKGLFLQAADPPAPPFLPWADIELVSMGFVDLGGEEHYLVDLVTTGENEDEVGIRLRVDGIDFKHDWLGLRMQPSTRENLKLFICEIRVRSAETRFTGKTSSFLAGDVTASFRFNSPAAFDDYTQWALEALAEAEDAAE